MNAQEYQAPATEENGLLCFATLLPTTISASRNLFGSYLPESLAEGERLLLSHFSRAEKSRNIYSRKRFFIQATNKEDRT